jgi:hypothetical protein
MINSLIKGFLTSNTGFYLLIVATVGDLIVPFFLAPFCNKYNHLTMVMSLLGNRNTPVHTLYNIWLIMAGIMLMLGNIKLYATYNSISKVLTVCMFVIIILYAIGACILSGIFSVGETKELMTISEKIHGYGSVLGFFLLTFLPLVIGILSFRSNDLTVGILSLLFFVLALTFFSLFIMADKEKFAQTVVSYEGLWQRLSLLCMYAPIVIASFKKLL